MVAEQGIDPGKDHDDQRTFLHGAGIRPSHIAGLLAETRHPSDTMAPLPVVLDTAALLAETQHLSDEMASLPVVLSVLSPSVANAKHLARNTWFSWSQTVAFVTPLQSRVEQSVAAFPPVVSGSAPV